MPPRVLVAEDNPEIQQLIQHILARDGYEIHVANDGQQAIEMIGAERFDAILLDFMMPLASGFDVVHWIEENRPDAAKGCVIIITAAVRELASFDKSKVFATIPKPFDVEQLRNVVKDCVANRSQGG